MKKRIFLLSIVALFVSAIITISTPTQTHADAILDIAAFTDLYECYKDGDIEPSITNLIGDYHHISEYVKKGGLFATARPLPNDYQHTVGSNNLKCYDLVTGSRAVGKQNFTGIISNGKTDYSQQEMIDFLPKVGYNEPQGSGGNSNDPCASFIYTVKAPGYSVVENNERWTNQFCVSEVDSSSKITNNSKITINSTRDEVGPKLSKKDRDRAIKVQYGKKIALVNGETFDEYVLKVYNEIKRVRPEYSEGEEVTLKYTLKQYDPSVNITGGAHTADGNKVNGEWKIDDMETAADIAIKNFSSFSSHNDLKFTSEQKSTLYKHYLKNWYGATVICEGDSGYENLPATAAKATNVTSKNCFVNATKHTDNKEKDKVHGIKSDMTWYQDLSFEQLVAEMSEEDILGTNTFSDPEEEGGGSTEEDRDPDCFTNAGALGSIICPAIDGASKHVEQAYTNLVEPYLQIDALLFDASTTGGKAVQKIWGIFQGFANLAFVLIFLFVIFSQLTGVGIDNYGIKKILPKLIIGAVLINLSYIICQLAVDMSNILGIAIKGLINNAGEEVGSIVSNLNVNLNSGHAKSVPLKVPTGTLVVVGIASVLGVTQFLSAGMAILIPALVALVSIAVGVMFLFIMLALRQAIAVILVVVSPMAFAAYLLPNTKKLLFDKWVEAFKGMLIAYPICSALVYGGDLVSKILLASEGTGADGTTDITSLGIILSAAAVSIAPIFFIPSVIKKGMDGIAGLSTIMNKAQGTIGGNATKQANARLNNSRLTDYQNRRSQEQSNRANARRDEKKFKAAGKRMSKLQRKIDQSGLGGLSTSDRAAYQDATSTINSRNKQMTDLYSQTFSTMGIGALTAELMKMGTSGEMDANLMQAAINRIGEIDQGKAVKSMSEFSKTAAFKNMNEKDKNRIIQTCLSQKGNPLLKAYAKALGRPGSKIVSFTEFANDASTDGLQHTLNNMGHDVFADMDKDVMDVIANSKGELGTNTEISKMFSKEQMAAGYGQGFSGSTGDKFNDIIAKRDNSQTKDDLKAISTKQLASVKSSALVASRHGGAVDVNAALADQVDDMKKDDNTELRSSMDNETRKFLGLDNSSTTP